MCNDGKQVSVWYHSAFPALCFFLQPVSGNPPVLFKEQQRQHH
jgi:hypothetical protein